MPSRRRNGQKQREMLRCFVKAIYLVIVSSKRGLRGIQNCMTVGASLGGPNSAVRRKPFSK